MTYILGWKLGPTVYLAADSAITVSPPDVQPYSSFGEKPVTSDGRTVYEGCLKLFNLDKAAVAICGDVDLARAAVQSFKNRLDRGDDPENALRTAVASAGPFDSKRSVHLLVSFPAPESPVLLSFNAVGDHRIIEHRDGSLVQLGSISAEHKGISLQALSHLGALPFQPRALLTFVLALLQSYGVHGQLLQSGAGGCFYGLTVGVRSIQWQKDILYCLYDETSPVCEVPPLVDVVCTIVRDHVIVARSNIVDSCRYFADSISSGSFEKWKEKWWDPAFDQVGKGRVDFVALINAKYWIIVVVEMMKRRDSKHFKLKVVPGRTTNESFVIECMFSPQLAHAMVQPTPDRGDGSIPFSFSWFPFEEPPGSTFS